MENEQLLPPYGELISLQDFIIYCGEGTFFDTDGVGYYSDGRVYWLDQEARPSDMVRFKISHNTKHRYVIWFKK